MTDLPLPQPSASHLVDPDDPAFGHIVAAARRLRQFGFDPRLPDIAERAIRAGREDYAQDPKVRARQSTRGSVARRHGADVLDVGAVVYYMRIGNRVKIGCSTNLVTRLAAINPEELMATEPGDLGTERERHEEFAELRTHGEWFRLEGTLAAHITTLRQEPAR